MLYNAWINLQIRKYGSLDEGLKRLNNALGCKLTHSRVNEYNRNLRGPSAVVMNYMLQEVLADQLSQLDDYIPEADRKSILAAVAIVSPASNN